MTTTSRPGLGRRLAAAATAAALGLSGVLALAAPASAAPGDQPTEPGTLTIHKFAQPSPAGALNNDGTPIADTSAWTAIRGVEFSIRPIGDVDLTAATGWETARAYATDPASVPSAALGTATTVVSGNNGATPTQTLPVGAYLVTETDFTGAEVYDGTSWVPANIVLAAAPFVVTVPIPTGDGTWNSDVHVYPKNSVTQISKEAGSPQGPGVGDVIPWTVSVKIPTLTAGESFTAFGVIDTLDAKLAYAATPAPTVTIAGSAVAFADASTAGPVDLRVTDLAALEAAQGQEIDFTFHTTVLASGEIENIADVYINDPTFSDDTKKIVTPPAEAYYVPVELIKHAAGDEAMTLAGAVFSVHLTAADASAGVNPVTVNGETTFTTGANGAVTIPGLFAGTDAQGDAQERTYYLREVTPPAGYDLDPNLFPYEFTVTSSQADLGISIQIPNPQKPSITLPMTGGAGTVTLVIAGVGLVLAAAGAALITARRRTRAAR